MNTQNDRRALTAILLSLLVFFVWSWFFAPTPEPTADVDGAAEAGTAPSTPSAPASVPAAAAPAVVSAPCVAAPRELASSIATLEVDNCGRLLSAVTMSSVSSPLTVTPWWTWLWGKVSGGAEGGWQPYVAHEGNIEFLTAQGAFGYAGREALGLPSGTWEVSESSGAYVLRRLGADGLLVTQELRPTAEPDLFDLTVRWESQTPLTGPFWVGAHDALASLTGHYDAKPQLEAVVDGDLEALTDPTTITTETTWPGPVSWFGVSERYFLAALAPKDPAWGTLRLAPLKLDGPVAIPGAAPGVPLKEAGVGIFLVSNATSLSPGQPLEASFRLYVGPKDAERLNTLGGGLEEAAALGFWGFFAKILLFFLHMFHSAVQNWGWAIVALTFLVRLSLYPMARSAFLSGKKMSAVQPRLKEIQEKFKDDKEAQSRETMKLFQETGANPLSGCLPLLVQMPVFFALYTALSTTPDLFQAPFFYIQDLSAPDPIGLMPALMMIGMVLQQRMTPMTGLDPSQQTMMKIMPFVFAGFMFGVPAGLSLYYVVNTFLAILQQWYNVRSWEQQQAAAPS